MAQAKRVLVIEDQATVADMLLAVLADEGFEARACLDPSQALSDTLAFRPDLIILDVVMPGVSGGEVLRQIRTTPGSATTPVLVLTAYHAAADQLLAEGQAGLEVVDKPFDLEELMSKIRQMAGA